LKVNAVSEALISDKGFQSISLVKTAAKECTKVGSCVQDLKKLLLVTAELVSKDIK